MRSIPVKQKVSAWSEESLAVSSYCLELLPGADSGQVQTQGLIDEVLAKFPAFRSDRNFQVGLLSGFRHNRELAAMSLHREVT